MLDEGLDALFVLERLLLVRPVVAERDLQARVEVGQLADSLEQGVVVELDIAEDFLVRLEGDFRSPLVRGADELDRPGSFAASALEMVMRPVAIDIHLEPLAQGVDDADADAVKPAGHLVAVGVELAARMQGREHDLQGADLGFLVHLDRDASTVVLHAATAVGLDADRDAVAETGERFVDRIVQHFVDEMVESRYAAVADVHVRPLADSVHSTENLDITGIVFMCLHTGPQKSTHCSMGILPTGRADTKTAIRRPDSPLKYMGSTHATPADWNLVYYRKRPPLAYKDI